MSLASEKGNIKKKECRKSSLAEAKALSTSFEGLIFSFCILLMITWACELMNVGKQEAVLLSILTYFGFRFCINAPRKKSEISQFLDVSRIQFKNCAVTKVEDVLNEIVRKNSIEQLDRSDRNFKKYYKMRVPW